MRPYFRGANIQNPLYDYYFSCRKLVGKPIEKAIVSPIRQNDGFKFQYRFRCYLVPKILSPASPRPGRI